MAFILVFAFAAGAVKIGFDSETPGSLPKGWTVAMTHSGEAPRWEILRDETSAGKPLVFAQLSRGATAGRFPLAIFGGAQPANGDVSVSFKTVSGAVDQAAGLVWRYADPNNYYIARVNALENNVVLYKVQDGVRLSIAPKRLPSRAYGVNHAIARGTWGRLRVHFQGNVFSVFLNAERMFDAEDATFQRAGKTGLWTKADSVIYFRDFEVKGIDGHE